MRRQLVLMRALLVSGTDYGDKPVKKNRRKEEVALAN